MYSLIAGVASLLQALMASREMHHIASMNRASALGYHRVKALTYAWQYTLSRMLWLIAKTLWRLMPYIALLFHVLIALR